MARRYTPDVTEIYSPNATWPAVKAALQGASLVVYMGHGNGWPSRYRDALYRPTQDGFGLNPSAGGNDSHASVLRGGPDRRVGQAREGRGRPAPPPVLRQRPVGAGPARGHAGPGASSASTTSRPGSSTRARRRSSPRRMTTRRGTSSRSSAATGRSMRSGARRRAPTITCSDSRASAARATSRRWTRSTRRRASNDPSCCGRASRRRTSERALADRPAAASAAVAPGAPDLLATGISLGTPSFKGLTAAGGTATLRIPFKIKDRGDLPEVDPGQRSLGSDRRRARSDRTGDRGGRRTRDADGRRPVAGRRRRRRCCR